MDHRGGKNKNKKHPFIFIRSGTLNDYFCPTLYINLFISREKIHIKIRLFILKKRKSVELKKNLRNL